MRGAVGSGSVSSIEGKNDDVYRREQISFLAFEEEEKEKCVDL
jgi:hypothetical protein